MTADELQALQRYFDAQGLSEPEPIPAQWCAAEGVTIAIGSGETMTHVTWSANENAES